MTRVNDNAFLAYGDRLDRKEKLTGPIYTRAHAKVRYDEIRQAMHGCETLTGLQAYLASIEPEIRQFEQELDYFWHGDGADFAGLSDEMITALEKFRGPIPGSRAAVAHQEEGTGL
ncbi:hypothetical protein [Sphingobium sp. HDIP04]|uniref:hypothetical protein n=1 Tax=Sphingobium sp. HDIP04 TaxID=428994 RepID=UPI0003878EE9|nr:hypothetical protein [Sphingobium sp. HDIP04]EQB03900.1 hypothetical protein L286_11080 [Sphingobium sp. HDIP04]